MSGLAPLFRSRCLDTEWFQHCSGNCTASSRTWLSPGRFGSPLHAQAPPTLELAWWHLPSHLDSSFLIQFLCLCPWSTKGSSELNSSAYLEGFLSGHWCAGSSGRRQETQGDTDEIGWGQECEWSKELPSVPEKLNKPSRAFTCPTGHRKY